MFNNFLKNRSSSEWLRDGGRLFFGVLLFVVAYQVFFLPNGIVSGGIGGVGVMMEHLFGFSPSLVVMGFNIPLLVLCWLFLGKEAFFKTIVGSILHPVLLGMVSWLPPLTHDMLLASVFGGILTGIGFGLIFQANASPGGSSILVQMIGEYTPLSFGAANLLIDGIIVFFALAVFNVDTVMYALLSVIATSIAVDLVKIGGKKNLQILIISDHNQEIAQGIIKEMKHPVTLLDGMGGYSQMDRQVILFVMDSREYNQLAELIKRIDPNAFFVVTHATEVQGRGFSIKADYLLD